MTPTKETQPTMSVTVTAKVKMEDIRNIVQAAFGSCGSGYWSKIKKEIPPTVPIDETKRFAELEYPFHPGGALLIGVLDEDDQVDGKTALRKNLTGPSVLLAFWEQRDSRSATF
jgi:hypothetical protein